MEASRIVGLVHSGLFPGRDVHASASLPGLFSRVSEFAKLRNDGAVFVSARGEAWEIMKKTLTVTLDVPDEFESFSALEEFVQEAGRRFQQDLCRDLTHEMGDKGGETACPDCGSSATIRKGSRLRCLKTPFGEVEVSVPRRLCKGCGHSFFV